MQQELARRITNEIIELKITDVNDPRLVTIANRYRDGYMDWDRFFEEVTDLILPPERILIELMKAGEFTDLIKNDEILQRMLSKKIKNDDESFVYKFDMEGLSFYIKDRFFAKFGWYALDNDYIIAIYNKI